MNSIIKYALPGAAAVVGGLVFSALFSELLNGTDRETTLIMGSVLYLGFLIVLCTGVLASHLDKKR